MENNKLTPLQGGSEVTFIIPDTDSIGRLKEMNPAFSLTLKYRRAEDWATLRNQEVRAFYMGTKDIPNDKGDMVHCAVFVTEAECFMSAQTTLVEAVRSLPSGTPLAITYRERKTNKGDSSRSTCVFDVITLQ